MYKVKHALTPKPVCIKSIQATNLRSEDELFLLCRDPIQLKYLGPELWNKLSNKERGAREVHWILLTCPLGRLCWRRSPFKHKHLTVSL